MVDFPLKDLPNLFFCVQSGLYRISSCPKNSVEGKHYDKVTHSTPQLQYFAEPAWKRKEQEERHWSIPFTQNLNSIEIQFRYHASGDLWVKLRKVRRLMKVE